MMMIHFRFMAKVVDVETAFLYRKLEDEIYMQCPTGMKDIAKDVAPFWVSVFTA